MSEVNPALKTEVEESSACGDNQEDVIGRADIVRAPEEPDDFTSSDASTDKVNSGDDEKVQQQQSKEDKDVVEGQHPTANRTDFDLSKNTSGRGGATSRRGGSRGAARRGVGGRGGKGRKVPDTFYSYPSDFHASLFSPSKLNLPSGPFGLSANKPGNEGEGDSSRIPDKISVTPELITQLSNNINSGFFYVNNALELLKQSQLELYHAKFALEKICRLNDLTQGDLYPEEFASPMEAEVRQSENVFSLERGVASTSSDNLLQTNGQSISESVQVQLDPFQFMDIQSNLSPTMAFTPDFTVGRGGGGARGRRGGRGARGGGGVRRGRKRLEPEHFSSYNSQVSKEGLTKLIKRFDSSLDGKRAKDLNNNRHAAVVLHDIGPVLDKRGNGKSSYYAAAKIESSFEREISRVAKMTRSTFKKGLSSSSTSVKSLESTSTKQSSSGNTKLSEGDVEDTKMEEEKQVSQKENPPQRIDVEENEASKVPELVTSNPNNNSSTRRTSPSTKSVRQVEDNLLPKKTNSTKKDNLPHWRQLRVEPEVMDRIYKRLEDSFRSASQSDTDSFYSSVSDSQSQQSVTSRGKRSKKLSPSSQQSKRQKVDPSSSSSSLSTSPTSTISITSAITMKSTSSTKSNYGAGTPSDEEMLGLTPNKDHCDCTSAKEGKKLGKEQEEIVQFSTKVQRVTVDSAFDNNDDSINSEGPDEDEQETEDENDGSNNSAYYSDAGEEEDDDDDDEDLFVEVRRKSKKHEGELIGT